MRRALAAVGVVAVLLLTACRPQSTTNMPMPDPSESPSASVIGEADDRGWIVEAENGYLTASSRVCSDEDLLTSAESEFPAIYLEEGGGPPDDWVPSEQFEVDSNGILLDFGAGEYDASRFDGANGIGTAWETLNGTLSVDRDAQGVITGGTGTGETRILHANGDSERIVDVVTFTVTVADEPAWCDIPF